MPLRKSIVVDRSDAVMRQVLKHANVGAYHGKLKRRDHIMDTSGAHTVITSCVGCSSLYMLAVAITVPKRPQKTSVRSHLAASPSF